MNLGTVVEFLNRHLSLTVTLQGVPCIAGLLYVYCVGEWPINCPCQPLVVYVCCIVNFS